MFYVECSKHYQRLEHVLSTCMALLATVSQVGSLLLAWIAEDGTGCCPATGSHWFMTGVVQRLRQTIC